MQRTVTVTTGGASGGPPVACPRRQLTSWSGPGSKKGLTRRNRGVHTQALQQNPSNVYAYVETWPGPTPCLANPRMRSLDLDQAIVLDPNNAGAYRDRGISKGSLRDYEGEVADLDEAGPGLQPDNDRGAITTVALPALI